MARTIRLIMWPALLLVLCGASSTTAASAEVADDAQVAPPASSAVAASCQAQTAKAEQTKDEVPRVRGVIVIGGCVADASGIEHLLLSWVSDDHEMRGRMCTDPSVVSGEWRCVWDTRRLPPGRFEVRMVAMDAAGNRGRFTRTYEVLEQQTEVDPADPSTPATPEQPTHPEQPAEPASPTSPDEPFQTVQQRMALDRVRTCERGGTEQHPTDADEIVTQQQQAQLVADCLAPVLRLVGALDVRLDEAIPVPPTILVVLEVSQAGANLRAVLPEQIAGVPIRCAGPDPTSPGIAAEPAALQQT